MTRWLALTVASIALGVAFLAGTLVLTDTMHLAFGQLFGKVPLAPTRSSAPRPPTASPKASAPAGRPSPPPSSPRSARPTGPYRRGLGEHARC